MTDAASIDLTTMMADSATTTESSQLQLDAIKLEGTISENGVVELVPDDDGDDNTSSSTNKMVHYTISPVRTRKAHCLSEPLLLSPLNSSMPSLAACCLSPAPSMPSLAAASPVTVSYSPNNERHHSEPLGLFVSSLLGTRRRSSSQEQQQRQDEPEIGVLDLLQDNALQTPPVMECNMSGSCSHDSWSTLSSFTADEEFWTDDDEDSNTFHQRSQSRRRSSAPRRGRRPQRRSQLGLWRNYRESIKASNPPKTPLRRCSIDDEDDELVVVVSSDHHPTMTHYKNARQPERRISRKAAADQNQTPRRPQRRASNDDDDDLCHGHTVHSSVTNSPATSLTPPRRPLRQKSNDGMIPMNPPNKFPSRQAISEDKALTASPPRFPQRKLSSEMLFAATTPPPRCCPATRRQQNNQSLSATIH